VAEYVVAGAAGGVVGAIVGVALLLLFLMWQANPDAHS
jgi:hypothetical protein